MKAVYAYPAAQQNFERPGRDRSHYMKSKDDVLPSACLHLAVIARNQESNRTSCL